MVKVTGQATSYVPFFEGGAYCFAHVSEYDGIPQLL